MNKVKLTCIYPTSTLTKGKSYWGTFSIRSDNHGYGNYKSYVVENDNGNKINISRGHFKTIKV